MLILLLFSMVTSSVSQLSWRQLPVPNNALRSPMNSRTFRRPVGRAAVTSLVASTAKVELDRPAQKLRQQPLTDKITITDDTEMKNDASIFAGNMSMLFIKEMSDYLFDLLNDKSSQHHHLPRSQRNSTSIRKASDVLDYEDQTRILEATNRTRHRSVAVMHSPKTTMNMVPIDQRSNAPRFGMSRRRANFVSSSGVVRLKSRRRFRKYGVA